MLWGESYLTPRVQSKDFRFSQKLVEPLWGLRMCPALEVQLYYVNYVVVHKVYAGNMGIMDTQ